MKLYNTLGRELKEFKPIEAGKVRIYTCGPTVYDYQHIGNYSGYIYWDVLIRLLKSQGLEVRRVINITDVGHLVSDSDEGQDKIEKGAAREGKTARQVADFYTEDFKKSVKALNLLEPDQYAKATDFIPEQIEIIKDLIDKGFAYQTARAIYFDVTKLSDYGKLTGQKLSDKEVGARSDVVTDTDKHSPQDFALWFFTVGRFAEHEMHWASPWGDGFPGWHIECSAIIHTLLGDPIDIHTGGVDHIGTHHTNEIAQTEAAFGHLLANFWMHNNHMMVDGQKISKSLGNGYTLQDLEKRGFSPMDFKILVLQSHYRSQSNFSWDTLEAAHNALNDIYAWSDLRYQKSIDVADVGIEQELKVFMSVLVSHLSDDLNTTLALSDIHKLLLRIQPRRLSDKSYETLLPFLDDLFGFELQNRQDISEEQKTIIQDRRKAREEQDWQKSDESRDQLLKQGIGLRDTDRGAIWYRL